MVIHFPCPEWHLQITYFFRPREPLKKQEPANIWHFLFEKWLKGFIRSIGIWFSFHRIVAALLLMTAWCQTITPSLFGSQTMVGTHKGDDFLQGRSLCVPSGWTPFHVLSWSGNNTRELCYNLRSCRFYSQPNCSLYCILYCCHYCCYSFRFSFLSHSFTVRMYTRSLTLTRPLTPYAPYTHTHTHTHTHTYATLTTMATADALDP